MKKASDCATTSIQKEIDKKYDVNELTDFLESLKNNIKYSKWFFEHYHADLMIDEKHIAMYEKTILI